MRFEVDAECRHDLGRDSGSSKEEAVWPMIK